MSDVRFYHLQRQSLEEALPKLMEKVIEAGLRAVIKAPDQAAVEALDKLLWDYNPTSFLPHDKQGCEHPNEQVFYLTIADENPNGASVLVLVDASKSEHIGDYDRCLYIFDGRNEDTVAAAREDWKRLKASDHSTSYWQQREQGGWEQKA
jgi:DNA polymerase-3 subunit chi